jgi:hypothetical protein
MVTNVIYNLLLRALLGNLAINLHHKVRIAASPSSSILHQIREHQRSFPRLLSLPHCSAELIYSWTTLP